MKKIALIVFIVLCLGIRAQEKTYLQNLSHYIENPAIFGEGQEDGRAYYIPSPNITLNGVWKFLYCKTPTAVPVDFFLPSFNDKKWDNIQVPSNWEMQGFGQAVFRNCASPFAAENVTAPNVPKELNPTGAYRTSFTIPSSWNGTQVFLRFEKVASASFIWVNGKQVGYNEGAQEPSEYNITNFVKPGKNSIAVMVIKYSDGYYLESQDYWRLAGVFDDVTIYSSPDTRIWDYQIITDFDNSFSDSKVNLAVELKSYQMAKEGYSLKAEISKDGKTICKMTEKNISISENGSKKIVFTSEVKSPKKWTAETPDLYNLTLTLNNPEGKIVDCMTKKIGFKKTEIKDGVFFLNGQPIKVNAQNSHMQHPTQGHYIDEGTIRKDMEILKQFGFNAVRTSHYPPVNKYLDLADEYGLYIIEETGDESHATEWVSEKPEFTEMYKERVRQMVLRDRNHACVLFWSAGNESGEGNNISEVVKEGKKYDPTRFWMYGGNGGKHPAEDIVGPRYPIPIEHEISYGLDNSDKRPSFMDEYVSVAGNGGGALDDFWREIDEHPSLLGGALWDFVSVGIQEPIRTLEDKSPYCTKANIMGRAKLVKSPTGLGLDLDVTDQWVQVYRSHNVEIDGNKLTLTLDIYPRHFNKYGGYMITKGRSQYGLRQIGTDCLEFYIDNGEKISLTGKLPENWENNWHNVCAVYDSKSMSIYIDSKIVSSRSASGNIRNLPISVCIGRNEEKHGQETREYIADAIIDNVGIFADAIVPEMGFDPQKSVLWLDFEKETTDGTFYSYGVGRTYGSIWPDRVPQPEMYQMKKSAQPIRYRLLDPRTGTVEIRNRNYFLNTSAYKTVWTITADDEIISGGTLELDIAPSTSKILNIPYTKPAIKPGKQYRLNLSTTLVKDEIWAKAGHEIAWEQFELSDWNIQAPTEKKPEGNVNITKDEDKIIVTGKTFKYTFNSGYLCEMVVNGKTLINEPLKLNLWRAPLANEYDEWNFTSLGDRKDKIPKGYGGIGFNYTLASMYYAEGLDKLGYIPVSVNYYSFENSVYVDFRELVIFGVQKEQKLDAYITGHASKGMECTYTYRIDADGTITLIHRINPQGSMPDWFPRIGISMSMDGSLKNVKWYGRGPQASYPDRKSGYRIGIYKSNIDEMYEPYLIPQDYGLRMDNRWVCFTDDSGCGIKFSMDEPFAFNAYPFTTENLTKSVYQYQLQRNGNITLNLDYATSGVGCTARGIFEAYKAHARSFDKTIIIKPIELGSLANFVEHR